MASTDKIIFGSGDAVSTSIKSLNFYTVSANKFNTSDNFYLLMDSNYHLVCGYFQIDNKNSDIVLPNSASMYLGYISLINKIPGYSTMIVNSTGFLEPKISDISIQSRHKIEKLVGHSDFEMYFTVYSSSDRDRLSIFLHYNFSTGLPLTIPAKTIYETVHLSPMIVYK